ncbi:MAG: alpha/beta hydrolase [Proteobacteria bacterium]|nr:alpha/beta hydrolase [Pseudomonadota bacterium]
MAETTRNIDPGMLAFYKALTEQTPAGSEHWPLDQQRAAWNALCKSFQSPRPPGVVVEDLNCNGVAVRLYKPKGKSKLTAVIYGHGGGWVLGSPDTHDDMCAELADGAGCAVLLMDYRLAPENPYPAQLEDSLKVWRWIRQYGPSHGLDPDSIIAAGDSAGGQMSAALALALHELSLPQLQGLVLIYPVLGSDLNTASYIDNADAPCLTKGEMIFYLTAFMGPEGSKNWHDAKAAPNLAADVSFLPPTFITVADHDPLRDDGVIFHRKLQSAGVPSSIRHEPFLAHSYMRARHHSQAAKEGFDAIVKALRNLATGGESLPG